VVPVAALRVLAQGRVGGGQFSCDIGLIVFEVLMWFGSVITVTYGFGTGAEDLKVSQQQ